MPWKVVKKSEGNYQLYNLHKKTYVKRKFKTRKSALNTRKNYEKYTKKEKHH